MPDYSAPIPPFVNGQEADANQVNTMFASIRDFFNVTGVHRYQNGSVITTALADGAITGPKIAANALSNTGTEAARPLATDVPAGFMYFATDTGGGTLYRSNALVWTQIANGLTSATVGDGSITTVKLANQAVTTDKLGPRTMGRQVADGFHKITADVIPPAGGTILKIVVAGDGATPMKINVHVPSVNAPTEIRLYDGESIIQTLQTDLTGASYEHVVPGFTGSKSFTVRTSISTTIVANTFKPTLMRATWAPGLAS